MTVLKLRFKYKYLKLTLDVDLVEFNKRITKEYKNMVNDMVEISINKALNGGGYPSFYKDNNDNNNCIYSYIFITL